jgi:DNA-directed RNA polymerase specialized sigma subunit
VDEEEVLEALTVVSSRWEVSLDQPVGGEADHCLGDLVAAPAVGEEPEDLLALPGLVARLPELEREVIILRFFQDLDQYEIAAGSASPRCTSRACSGGLWPACMPS